MTIFLALAPSIFAQSEDFRLDESRQWTGQTPPPEAGSDAALIRDARRLLAEDNPGAARDLLDPWIERTEREQNPYRAEALLLRGDALVALEREYKSLYDYEEIARAHRQSEQFPIAVERELDIALRYANGLKIRILGFRIGDANEVAVELFIRVQERLPRSQLAERAAIELADFYYREREMKQAYDAYDLYLRNFPSGPNVVHAKLRRIQSDIARFKGPRYNAAELINARTQVREFVDRYPAEAEASGTNDALIARLDESMGAQMLDTARWYVRTGDPSSARFTLRRLLRDFPSTLSAQRGESMLRENGWESDLPGMEPADLGGDQSGAESEEASPASQTLPDQGASEGEATPADEEAPR